MLFLLAFLLLRLIFWWFTFPNPDEAYYWLWGQRPDWSYYDHPPLQAWVEGMVTAVFGRSFFSLRLPNLFSNIAFFYTYYRIARYLYGEKARSRFWLIVALILASPLYFLFLALAWHDHLLITFSLVAAYLWIRFLDSYLADGKGETWRLYAASGAIALAELCKYNAVFVLAGCLATVVVDRRFHALGRDRRLYLAAVIVASGWIPIVMWNVLNDFQSFHYYVNRSVNTGSFSLKLEPCLGFVLFSILTVSPVNCLGFFRCFKQSLVGPSKLIGPAQSVYAVVAFWVFAISTVTLTVISLLSAALYYWNITAYLLLFPLLPAVFAADTPPDSSPKPQPAFSWPRHRLLLTGQGYGLLFATLLVLHYSVLPLSALVDKTGDPDSRMLFGWDNVAAVVKAQQTDLGASAFLAATDYRSASALAYQLNDRTVTAISDRIDQFDFWFNPTALQGKDAILLADEWHPLQPELRTQFDRLSEPTIVPVMRFGVWIKNYSVFKAYGFKGSRIP